MIAKQFALTTEEGKAILGLMRMHSISSRKLAPKLGLTHSYVAATLRGKGILTPERAKIIYETLGRDPRLDFLLEHIDQQHSSQHCWNRLYHSILDHLGQIYLSADSELKGKIICGLERMVEEYKK